MARPGQRVTGNELTARRARRAGRLTQCVLGASPAMRGVRGQRAVIRAQGLGWAGLGWASRPRHVLACSLGGQVDLGGRARELSQDAAGQGGQRRGVRGHVPTGAEQPEGQQLAGRLSIRLPGKPREARTAWKVEPRQRLQGDYICRAPLHSLVKRQRAVLIQPRLAARGAARQSRALQRRRRSHVVAGGQAAAAGGAEERGGGGGRRGGRAAAQAAHRVAGGQRRGGGCQVVVGGTAAGQRAVVDGASGGGQPQPQPSGLQSLRGEQQEGRAGG